ncbi:MAG: cupredoxin domain-containing protein [Ilumatobacteraceae bacterium]|nr:cupredoxin domain-containing protein [Ilumatobacteraceae bacterium]
MKTFNLLVGALAVGTTACASGPTTSTPTDDTVIEVVMTDMAFTPSSIDVAAGDTVTLRFRNDGTVRHEAVFGDLTEQLTHHEEMSGGSAADHDMSDMEAGDDPTDDHGELHAVALEPGSAIEVTHTFGASGVSMIGCHEPGHWEAGMQLDVNVT